MRSHKVFTLPNHGMSAEQFAELTKQEMAKATSTLLRRIAKEDALFEMYSVGPFKMSWGHAIQNLPKPSVGVDYGTVEKTIMAAYPGEDGFGADVYDLTDAFEKFQGGIARGKSARDYLEAPYGCSKEFPNETHCPKCQVPRKATLGLSNTYFDCPTCGGKKEDAR
jgi:hypothetical protein